MVQFLPSIEFYSQSLRGSDFLKNEVIPWGYISTFLAPDFLGNPVTRNDWFGHYAEWNAYIGVLPLMLAFYSIFSKNKSQVIFLFILSFIVLFLAFPTTLQDLFINLHIPVLSTSAASRIVVLYSFSFAILSAFGLDQLILDIKNKKAWKIIIWFLCFAIIFLILWIAAYTKLFIPAERIVVARNNLILPTSLFIISALIIFIWNINKKMTFVALSFLLLIVSFDMLRFVIKWMPFDPKNLVFPDTKTTRSFSKISGYNRVFGNLGGEASMYYRLPSVEGYDALYIKRYGELINFIEEGKPKNLYRSVVSFSKTGLYASRALNLLNIKYIVHKLADDYAGWTFPYWTYPKNQFKLIYRDNMYEFYENTQVFPRAFLVGQYRIVENPEKIMSLMFDDSFDLKKEIILEEDPVINKTEGDIGKVKIVSYQPNNIEISVEAKSRALLFLADSYYNGWKATIDGKNASVLRADYAFRAIPVNAGMHTVRFYYDPWSFKSGVYLSVLGLMGLLFIVWISRVGDHSMSAFSSQSQKGK
ncbi:MAG: YfhO family protein [Candidatus Levybacteria bacterium]|nr:YfhO family protein [Candidatus Levybacteria bacterium]